MPWVISVLQPCMQTDQVTLYQLLRAQEGGNSKLPLTNCLARARSGAKGSLIAGGTGGEAS